MRPSGDVSLGEIRQRGLGKYILYLMLGLFKNPAQSAAFATLTPGRFLQASL